MYVTTFYSFKGGTGRSMALVNVAVEMAKSGLRVLIVDFDLEAPGLDTFNLPRPQKTTKGMVDFISEYLEKGEIPNVSEFIYKSTLTNVEGELWIMPAGKPGDEYDSRFKSIDWRELYENRNGYLLIEDMKAQWNQAMQPDYVLIDSRTGHTDVSGICTRQLPDSVVLFFFPNEQNRRGLEIVASQIREESKTGRKRDIKLHYVMSNLPELDDEEGFLANNVDKLKESLKFNELSAVIHHYQSLVLLTQSVFTLDKPKTRLAQEYRTLASILRRDNLEDREVALEFLEELASPVRTRRMPAGELEKRIDAIQAKYNDDPEILLHLAAILRRQRRFEEALSLLELVGTLGASSAEFYLARAELYSVTGDSSAALSDVMRLLGTSDATYLEVSAAARLLQQRDPDSLGELILTPAFDRIDIEGQCLIANEMLGSRQGVRVAADIFREVTKRSETRPELNKLASVGLVLSLINQGQFEAAVDAIKTREKEPDNLDIIDSFNYAMAQWGLTSRPSAELFRRVVELDKQEPSLTANGHQCLSIALWAINETDEALTRVGEAWQQIATRPKPEFSCWSYMQLPHDEFLEDLREVRQLIEGKAIKPRFMREKKASGTKRK
jgi:MinD-like ATPase involved in chromosome partitioning or flagellar assembly